MINETARTKAREAEEALNLPDPVTLESIQQHLEKLRGRKIIIKPMHTAPQDKVCGLWFGLDDMDLILHAPAATGVHRQQIILHEYAHMILRHRQEVVSAELTKVFFPDLAPDRVVTALKRSDFLDEFEITAELLADRLAARIRKAANRRTQPRNFGAIFG